jgi:hypothetical protein
MWDSGLSRSVPSRVTCHASAKPNHAAANAAAVHILPHSGRRYPEPARRPVAGERAT